MLDGYLDRYDDDEALANEARADAMTQAEVEAELAITRDQVVDLEENLKRVAREQWAKHPNNPERTDG